MSDLQALITFVVFGTVLLAIVFDLLDMALAALLGVSTLTAVGVFTLQDILNVVRTFGGPLALLFGGMVVARTLMPTGLFDYIGNIFLRATRGSGKRFLLGVIVLVVLCAFLPNATTVLLLAPIIIQVASALKVDIVAPLVLIAIVSNSAGLLILVGDPATFLVGNSIGMTFTQYLRQVSLGGVLSLLTIVPLLPWVMGSIWRSQCALTADLKPEPLKHPLFAASSLVVLAVMVLLFLLGDFLPVRIVPPSTAIIGCSLALLVVYGAKIEPIDKVLKRYRLEDAGLPRLHFLPRGGVDKNRCPSRNVSETVRLAWRRCTGSSLHHARRRWTGRKCRGQYSGGRGDGPDSQGLFCDCALGTGRRLRGHFFRMAGHHPTRFRGNDVWGNSRW